MNVLGVLLAMVAPFVAIAVLGGWTVPLIMGILRNRRDGRGSGLIALGSAWGVCAIAGIIYLASMVIGLRDRFTPQTFDAAGYQGETGQVILSWRGPCELTAWGSNGSSMLTLHSDTGTVVAPVGPLRVSSWTLRSTDNRGREWSLTGRPSYEGHDARSTLNVSRAQPVELSVGPPLTARVVVDSSPGASELSLDFALTDRGGGSYTISGGGGDAPGFEVVDAAGKVVWSGDFEYG